MAKRLKVLSIDGGGIYGIVSAMILAEIERLSGKPVSHMFDLIAGTSTGGIITLGLTMPDATGKVPRYSAADMVDLYSTKGPQIFYRSALHQLLSINGLIDEKYESVGIERTLRKYFGEITLAEVLTDVLITAYHIERRDAYFFKSHKARKQEDRNFYIRDVARATAAPPTFFEPAKITNMSKSQEFVLVDGAIFANNPAMCAYAEIKAMYPEVNDVMVVSVGITGSKRPYLYEQTRDWGKAQWLAPVLEIMMDGVMQTVDYQLKQIYTKNHQRGSYIRLEAMTEGKINFDEPTETNIRLLKEFAGKYIDANQELLKSLAEELI
jgi:uncharacterized protein